MSRWEGARRPGSERAHPRHLLLNTLGRQLLSYRSPAPIAQVSRARHPRGHESFEAVHPNLNSPEATLSIDPTGPAVPPSARPLAIITSVHLQLRACLPSDLSRLLLYIVVVSLPVLSGRGLELEESVGSGASEAFIAWRPRIGATGYISLACLGTLELSREHDDRYQVQGESRSGGGRGAHRVPKAFEKFAIF